MKYSGLFGLGLHMPPVFVLFGKETALIQILYKSCRQAVCLPR